MMKRVKEKEREEEEERGGVGGGGVNLGGHRHWSWIPSHQLLKASSARMGTCVHANTHWTGFARCFLSAPTDASVLRWLCAVWRCVGRVMTRCVCVTHTLSNQGGGGTLIAKHKAGEIWMKRRDCDWRFIYFDFSQKGHGSGWVAGLSTLSIPPKIVTTMELKCSPKSTNHIAETREPVLRVWSPFSLFNPLYNGQLNEWFSERFKAHFYCWTTGAKVSKQGGEEGYVGKKV